MGSARDERGICLETIDQLAAIAGKECVLCSEPMWKHTTFHIGGPADYFINITGEDKLAQIMEVCRRDNIPVFILGNGSNLLVSDEGYRGAVLRLWGAGSQYSHTGETGTRNPDCFDGMTGGGKQPCSTGVTDSGNWCFPAGMTLTKAAMMAAQQSFAGFKFAAGIPGTVGGAVVMNAGAYGGEISDCIVKARVMERDGSIREYTKEELQLSYRSSILQRTGGIVLHAEFALPQDDREAILGRIEEMNRKRREKQPLEFYSAGSTFKRPEGHYAGQLIMEAGLAGFHIGDARVSEKHCGFLINTGNATAAQMKELISEVIRRVREHSGVELEPEIRFLG